MDRQVGTNSGDSKSVSSPGGDANLNKGEKKKVFKSSVVIIPPDECSGQIQTIREEHDKHFKRWMPHINLLYPFIEDDKDGQNFTEAAEMLMEGLRQVKPFTVKLTKDSFGYFEHKSFSTLWLKPLEEKPVKVTDTETETIAGKTQKLALEDGPSEGGATGNDLVAQQREAATGEDNSDHQDIRPSGAAVCELGACSDHNDVNTTKQKKSRSEKKRERKAKQKEVTKNKNTTFSSDYRAHPDVLRLQSSLEQVYPKCNDLSVMSPAGFNPHLSLGQFDRGSVSESMEEFKRDWVDVEYEVKEVCLISRENFDDPFQVRSRVQLGAL